MQHLNNLYKKLITDLTHKESGQSTAEYALVILGAAGIAMLLITWANGSGSIGNLFDSVISRVTAKG
jgi:Flp pilus assembly pilin Flp